MIQMAGHYTQMFSLNSDVPQVFNKSEIASRKTYSQQRIWLGIFFFAGSGCLLLSFKTFNNFEIKNPNRITGSAIYKKNIFNLKSHRNLNRIAFEKARYCNISRCNSVTCSFIPAPLDSGKEVSIFIENTFKVECFGANRITTLTFQSCNFLKNILGPAWLQTDLSIDNLSFVNCQLKEIHDEAFSQPYYRTLKRLSVKENNISTLRSAVFQMLVKLECLTIHDNVITFAESNLLGNLASSLQILELHKSIKNSNVLKNITGQNILPNIEILSIQGNSLPILSSELFQGIPNVKSIYVDRSEVREVMDHAFLPIANSIKQLSMMTNSITTLKPVVFETILKNYSNFVLNIDANPWHCDCSMKWLHILRQKYPDIVKNDLVCRTPANKAGVPFSKVNFCNDSELSSSTVTSTTIDDASEPGNLINVTCNNLFPGLYQEYSKQLLIKMNYQFTKLSNFSVKEMTNGSILVNVPNTNFGFTLVWFSNKEYMSNSDILKSNLKCIKSIRKSLLLKRLKPATSYTLCLLEADEKRLSPLNCIALITSVEYAARIWLSNGDKPIIISLFAIILCLLSILSAIFSYVVIRRNPTLLRGSKRILIVRRRTVNAVVLPEGVHINSHRNTEVDYKKSALEDHDYFTPLRFSQKTRKDSQLSGASSQSSDASYVSGIQPNLIQLATWRIHRLRDSTTQEMEKSPPLPPNHPRNIPSLSYNVEFKDNDESLKESAKYDN